MKKNTNQLEVFALRINVIISFAYTIFSIITVYFARSLTVFLDTSYSLVALLIYVLSLYVIKKIKQPANSDYPYGYYKLEPIFVMVQSAFVLLLAASIIIVSILNLFTHNIAANYTVALIVTTVAVLTCTGMYFFILKIAKNTGSKILIADAELWKADAVLSVGALSGILIGFC